jgi:hypothetical protein
MLRKATLLMAAFATLVFTTPAVAQSICGERSRFIERLQEQYRESLNAVGLAADGTLVEVMTSEKGSWTIMITRADGVSCIVATGEAWESVPKLAMGPAA